jgi:hypothetical protein
MRSSSNSGLSLNNVQSQNQQNKYSATNNNLHNQLQTISLNEQNMNTLVFSEDNMTFDHDPD